MVTVRDDINQKLLLYATIEIVSDFSTHSTSLRARLSVEMTDVDSLELHDRLSSCSDALGARIIWISTVIGRTTISSP